MDDNRSTKLILICDANVDHCEYCPLAESCARCHGKPKTDYDNCMNEAAKAIEV